MSGSARRLFHQASARIHYCARDWRLRVPNARQSGATDDGILTAAEVAQLDLLGTQLVVLLGMQHGAREGSNGLKAYMVCVGRWYWRAHKRNSCHCGRWPMLLPRG